MECSGLACKCERNLLALEVPEATKRTSPVGRVVFTLSTQAHSEDRARPRAAAAHRHRRVGFDY
eukprot:3833894-Prymnesium_polylepis.1